MKKLLIIALLLSPGLALTQTPPPAPASAQDVIDGLATYKFVTPYSLSQSGVSTNTGISATGVSNIVNLMRVAPSFHVGGNSAIATNAGTLTSYDAIYLGSNNVAQTGFRGILIGSDHSVDGYALLSGIKIGDAAGGVDDKGIAIGHGSLAGLYSVGIGDESDCSGAGAILVGGQSYAQATNNIVIGFQSDANSQANVIVIGSHMELPTAPNQIFIGNATHTNTHIYGRLHGNGNGFTNIPASAMAGGSQGQVVTWHGSGAIWSNPPAGGSVTLTNFNGAAGLLTGGSGSYGIGTNISAGTQTPWTVDINAAQWSLTNASSLQGSNTTSYSAGRVTFVPATASGDVIIAGGTNVAGADSQAGGDVVLRGGKGGTGSSTGGDVELIGGDTAAGTGGNIILTPGDPSGGSPGEIIFNRPPIGDGSALTNLNASAVTSGDLNISNVYVLGPLVLPLTNVWLRTDATGRVYSAGSVISNAASIGTDANGLFTSGSGGSGLPGTNTIVAYGDQFATNALFVSTNRVIASNAVGSVTFVGSSIASTQSSAYVSITNGNITASGGFTFNAASTINHNLTVANGGVIAGTLKGSAGIRTSAGTVNESNFNVLFIDPPTSTTYGTNYTVTYANNGNYSGQVVTFKNAGTNTITIAASSGQYVDSVLNWTMNLTNNMAVTICSGSVSGRAYVMSVYYP